MKEDRLQPLVDAWHRADQRAVEAERRFRAAWEANLADGKPMPQDLAMLARLARSEANARLREAVALAQALGHPFGDLRE